MDMIFVYNIRVRHSSYVIDSSLNLEYHAANGNKVNVQRSKSNLQSFNVQRSTFDLKQPRKLLYRVSKGRCSIWQGGVIITLVHK